jgi:hypothetical protein
MGLRDLLRKKNELDNAEQDPETVNRLATPEFTFIRSDTISQEIIHPPSHPVTEDDNYLTAKDNNTSRTRRSLDVFRSSRSRSASVSSQASKSSKHESRRLSQRLHLSRAPASSEYVPDNLPEIITTSDTSGDQDATESQWEKRATILAQTSDSISRPSTPNRGVASRSSDNMVSSKAIDEDIQEAIRLHEEGDLERSTAMFGRLADTRGANNPLSQVLYGLALRYVFARDRCPSCRGNPASTNF